MFLSRTELIELTGYKQPRKQALALAEMGKSFDIRPDGRVIVAKSQFEGNAKKVNVKSPNWEALDG